MDAKLAKAINEQVEEEKNPSDILAKLSLVKSDSSATLLMV